MNMPTLYHMYTSAVTVPYHSAILQFLKFTTSIIVIFVYFQLCVKYVFSTRVVPDPR